MIRFSQTKILAVAASFPSRRFLSSTILHVALSLIKASVVCHNGIVKAESAWGSLCSDFEKAFLPCLSCLVFKHSCFRGVLEESQDKKLLLAVMAQYLNQCAIRKIEPSLLEDRLNFVEDVLGLYPAIRASA